MLLLVNPPVAKPGEPPAGVAKLSGALTAHGIRHLVLDANIEGLLFLLHKQQESSDTWTNRARRNIEKHLASLKTPALYRSLARYQRAVMDLNRVLEMSSAGSNATVGLANYQHQKLSPLRTSDLLHAAERPEENPYYPYFQQRLAQILEKEPIGQVGVSLNYLSQALTAFAMIGFLRKCFPEVKIILGGGLVTSWMRSRGRNSLFPGLVDRVIAGPGEGELLSMLGVAGDCRRHCRPSYDLLPLQHYLSPGHVLPYSGSSGCWWNKCSFCPERAEGNPYVPVPAATVVDDLAWLAKEMQPGLMHILDNSMPLEHMKAFIAQPPAAPWYAFARVSRELADQDFCRELKRSGCVMLKLGLESGDQDVLDAMKKGLELETASKALRALKKAGIAAYVYLIFGTPAESRKAAGRTLAFTAAHSDAIGFLNLAIFNMPAYGDEAARFGTQQFYEGDLSLYTDFRHPQGWDRKLVRQFLEAEFKRHPAISPIVKRDPPFFGSNHAPFFVMEQG